MNACVKKVTAVLALVVGSAAAAAPPCGDTPECPTGYGADAQTLQTEYRFSLATDADKAKIEELVQLHSGSGKTDWAAAAAEYFAWRKQRPAAAPAVDGAAIVQRSKQVQWELQEAAEAAVRQRMIDPQSAQFEWPHGFMDGYWKPFLGKKKFGWVTCGFVNARNRLGGYVGRAAFAIVIDKEDLSTVRHLEIENKVSGIDPTAVACAKTSAILPVFMGERAAGAAMASAVAPVSVADELEKLAGLRDRKIITDEEFEAQKAKLLRAQ